jgi:hypothetical protein
MGPRSGLLNQLAHFNAVNSTASNDRQGPRRWMTSALSEAVDGFVKHLVMG